MHTETIEETIEVLPVKLTVAVNSPVGITVGLLAAYGAKNLVADVRTTVTEARKTWKAKKAAKKLATPASDS